MKFKFDLDWTEDLLLRWAEIINAYRVIPRVLVGLYGYILYDITNWFMTLTEPTNSQSVFISTVYGAAAGIFGLYTNTGNEKHYSAKRRREDNGRDPRKRGDGGRDHFN